MQVSVEIMSGLERRLTVSVPANEFEKEVVQREQHFVSRVKLPGFRPGKVPVSLVRKQYGEAIRGEAADKLIQATLRDALTQEHLRPAQAPSLHSLKAEMGQPLEYSVVFEVLPEVQLKDLSTVVLEKWLVSLEEKDVEKVLGQMTKQQVKWEEVSRPAQKDDHLTIDFYPLADDGTDAGGENKDIPFLLNETNIAAGFDKLVGAQVGESVTVTFPANQKKARILIHKIQQPIYPELNDEFAKSLGVNEGLEALRKQVQEHLRTELDNLLKNRLKTQLIDKIVEMHAVSLPKSLLEQEQKHLAEQLLHEMVHRTGHKFTWEQLPDNEKKRIEHAAQQRVTLGLLFPEMIKMHDIKVDEARVNTQIEKTGHLFEDVENFERMARSDQTMMSNIRAQVLEDQLFEHLLSQVKFNEITKLYEEAIVELR